MAPCILGDRGVLLGRQYPSPSHGVTAFHRRTASLRPPPLPRPASPRQAPRAPGSWRIWSGVVLSFIGVDPVFEVAYTFDPTGPRPAGATDIETTSPWNRWRVVALLRIASGHAGFRGRRPSAFFTPPHVLQTPAPLPDASRTIVGTGAGFDLLPVDEALDLADDVGAARIIFHTASIIVCMSGIIVDTDRYVVGTRGNEVSGRRNEVSARGTDRGNNAGKGEDDLTGVGTDAYTAGNAIGKRAGETAALGLVRSCGGCPRTDRCGGSS